MHNNRKKELDFLCPENLRQMFRELQLAGKLIAKEQKINSGQIFCDALIVREAFVRARQTIHYHENTSNPTHHKELAHFCHWVMRLKPFKLVRFQEIPAYQKFAIPRAMLKPIEEENFDLNEGEQRINEYTAIRYAIHTVAVLEKEFINSQVEDSKITPENAKKQLESLRLRLEDVSNFSSSLACSFREHTYSARATAMIFELAFSTKLIDDDDTCLV